jgi:hypothetical protein
MLLISGGAPAPPDGAPVTAVTVITDVMDVPELVMNCFSPSMTHSPAPSSRTARVRVAPASLPASGSVSPNAPSARPASRSGFLKLVWVLVEILVHLVQKIFT